MAPAKDDASRRLEALNGEENAKTDAARVSTTVDAPPATTLAQEESAKAQGVAAAQVNADTPSEDDWPNVRTPLNLDASDPVSGGDAAWWNVRNTLNLEAKEAKQLVVGAGNKLEALVGDEQLHLLMGGSLLLVAGLVVGFVRRARKRSAAEKTLENETYYLVAQP